MHSKCGFYFSYFCFTLLSTGIHYSSIWITFMLKRYFKIQSKTNVSVFLSCIHGKNIFLIAELIGVVAMEYCNKTSLWSLWDDYAHEMSNTLCIINIAVLSSAKKYCKQKYNSLNTFHVKHNECVEACCKCFIPIHVDLHHNYIKWKLLSVLKPY